MEKRTKGEREGEIGPVTWAESQSQNHQAGEQSQQGGQQHDGEQNLQLGPAAQDVHTSLPEAHLGHREEALSEEHLENTCPIYNRVLGPL